MERLCAEMASELAAARARQPFPPARHADGRPKTQGEAAAVGGGVILMPHMSTCTYSPAAMALHI